MSQPRKFGTFGGVFTPSILTILGVIMYMRLGWVVGNAGSLPLIFLIILMAHLVSVTTGLSVSSVATDKKIKAGGIYYMLSRSLGLPIGGAIGITLFVATALSIALYLIGFAESALAVLKEPLGIEEITLNHLRLVGSIALVTIVTIAFISTSIAIKSQYFILGAIVLSLFSVFFGSMDNKVFDLSNTASDPVGFATLFGVFFPAVTGFTAGVAMSGDLKDPKKSIPWGTMLAIATGLVVYLSLAIFIFYSIDPQILKSDNNALVVFGLIPGLVIAGIWGATLSSALGGILGGPRILQAMSVDKITPKLFAKGVGAENEPRNALILTFIIAECGILIGELDVIAEVVAMFYMSAYLFINISCFLEQWASPDFLPKFRIPLIVPLLGAIVTFLLMIQLNLVASVAAIFIMILIFLYLTRKQLDLGSGNVWQNVWYGVVKLGINNILTQKGHKRNWEPNMLTFFKQQNDEISTFSKTLTGKIGFLTQFHSLGSPDQEAFLKQKEAKGIYHKVFTETDYVQGIINTAKHYGFSGVEPNTILLSVEDIKPYNYQELHQELIDLDFNVFYLSVNKKRGFGQYKKIDIWWEDFSEMTELSLSLAKFFSQSTTWGNADIRVLFHGLSTYTKEEIKQIVNDVANEFRLTITVETVDYQNQVDEVINEYSFDADLIVRRLSGEPNFESDSISTLWVYPSNYFHQLDVSILLKSPEEEGAEVVPVENKINSTVLDKSFQLYPVLRHIKTTYETKWSVAIDKFEEVEQVYVDFLHQVNVDWQKQQGNFAKLTDVNPQIKKEVITKNITSFYFDVVSKLNALNVEVEEVLTNPFSDIFDELETFYQSLPKKIKRKILKEDLVVNKQDDFYLKIRKRWYKFLRVAKGKSLESTIRLKEVIRFYHEEHFIASFSEKEISLLLQKVKGFNGKIGETLSVNFNKIIQQEANTFSNTLIEVNKLELNFVREIQNQFTMMLNHYISDLENGLKHLRINALVEEKREKSKPATIIRNKRSIQNLDNELPIYMACKVDKMIHNTTKYGLTSDIQHFIDELVVRTKEMVFDKKRQEIQLIEEVLSEDQIQTPDAKENALNFFNGLKPINISLKNYLRYSSNKINQSIHKANATLLTLSEEQERSFISQTNKLKPKEISFKDFLEKNLKNNLIHPIETEAFSMERSINNSIYDFKTKARILEVTDFSKTEEVNIALEQLYQEYEAFITLFDNRTKLFYRNITKFLEQFWEGYSNIYLSGSKALPSTKKQLPKQFIRISENSGKIVKSLSNYVQEKTDELIGQSKTLAQVEQMNDGSKLNWFLGQVKPNKELLASIPVDYQKVVGGDLYVDKMKRIRKKELEVFAESFDENKPTIRLLVGDFLSGKKTFVKSILEKHFQSPLILESNISNKSLVSCFDETIQLATGDQSIEKYIQENNVDVLVFNHMERWLYSNEVMQAIHEIINENESLHVIFTCSTTAYENKLKYHEVYDRVTQVIKLKPLSSDIFINEVQQRLTSSGYQHYFLKRGNQELSKKELKKFEQLAQGNLGLFTYIWFSRIARFGDHKVYIKPLKRVYFPEINNPDWIVILKLLVIYGSLNRYHLGKKLNKHLYVDRILIELTRIGIIEEVESGVYECSPYAFVYVKKYLKEKNIIN